MSVVYCPRCRTALQPLFNGRAEIDHCPNCRGNWLEAGDTARTFGAWAEPSHWREEHIAEDRGPSVLWCPAGHGRLHAWHLRFEKQQVELDVCPACSGMWLDVHEGGRLSRVVGDWERKKGAPPGVASYFFQLFTGFPIEVFNPVRKTPWLVYSLLVVNIALFGLEALLLAQGQSQIDALLRDFAVVPRALLQGRDLHTLITYAFLHGGVMHLVGNMYFLWIFGDNVEDRTGRFGFLLIYFGAALLGAVAHVLSDPGSDIPMLGASGAISGLMGAYVVLFPRVRVWVVFFFVRFQISIYWYLGFWVLLQVVGVLTDQFGVAWFAHLGGFAAGLGLGFLFRLSGNKKAVRTAQQGPRTVTPRGPRGF